MPWFHTTSNLLNLTYGITLGMWLWYAMIKFVIPHKPSVLKKDRQNTATKEQVEYGMLSFAVTWYQQQHQPALVLKFACTAAP